VLRHNRNCNPVKEVVLIKRAGISYLPRNGSRVLVMEELDYSTAQLNTVESNTGVGWG